VSLQKELERIAAGMEGTLGLAIRVPHAGDEFRINDQKLFPLASVFKIPLLVELYNQIERGKLRLDDPVELTEADRTAGSGVLKEFLPGARITVWDLAVLMMIVSDNMATDILYRMVDGRQTVTAQMRRLGLEQIAVPFDCAALLNACVGLDPYDRTPAVMAEAVRRLRANEYDLNSIAFEESLANNCTTAADMMELLTMIEQRKVVSPAACDGMIDIMLRQQLNQRIPLLLPQPAKVAHKTGTLGSTRNDAGIIYLPNGNPIIIAAFTSDVEPANWRQGDMAIAEVALTVYEAYMG